MAFGSFPSLSGGNFWSEHLESKPSLLGCFVTVAQSGAFKYNFVFNNRATLVSCMMQLIQAHQSDTQGFSLHINVSNT